MNKVISINIGGSIFQVEENAYEKLNSYLNELKKYFSNKSEGNEIITDIESRIAELLRSKLNVMKQAINLDDVTEVTISMGAPKDFAAAEEDGFGANGNASEEKKETKGNGEQESVRNKVYRDPEGRIIGGVCSGLGHYFKIDPVWIRLFFIVVALTSLKLIFFGASPILIYIILWIVIPEAKTTAEKLHMRKEKINIDNIQKSVQTEFGKVKDAVQNPKLQDQATSVLRSIFDFVRQLVIGVLNVFRHVGKAFLYFFSVLFFVIAIASLSGRVNFNSKFDDFNFNLFHFFENNSDKVAAHAAVFACFLALGLIALLLANGLSRNRFYGRTSFLLRTTTILVSITAIILLVFSSTRVASYFAASEKIENTIPLDTAQRHFYIKSNSSNYDQSFPFLMQGDTLRVKDVEVSVESTEGPSEIVIITKSYGQNGEIARLNASGISALLSVHDSVISIPEFFSISNSQVYRRQEVKYKIKLHNGTRVTVDQDYWSSLMLRNDNGFHRASSGRTYTLTTNGAECLDCSKMYSSGNVNTSAYPLNIGTNGQEFSHVKVSSDINVKVVKGDHYLIKARGTNNKDHLDIDFVGNSVHISDNRKWTINLLNELHTIEVLIVMPEVNSLELSGVVQAQFEGFNEKNIKIEMSGTATCIANIKAENLEVDQEGATNLTLDGKFETLNASVSGASKLYAANASSKTVDLEVSGASYAEVDAEDVLDAKASGASNIRYKGHVHDVRSKNTGASSVEVMK